jgi:hypothetical protein
MGNLLVRAMNASLNIGPMFERCGWYNEISLEAETESFEPSFCCSYSIFVRNFEKFWYNEILDSSWQLRVNPQVIHLLHITLNVPKFWYIEIVLEVERGSLQLTASGILHTSHLMSLDLGTGFGNRVQSSFARICVTLENHGEAVRGDDEVVETNISLLVARSMYSQNLIGP